MAPPTEAGGAVVIATSIASVAVAGADADAARAGDTGRRGNAMNRAPFPRPEHDPCPDLDRGPPAGTEATAGRRSQLARVYTRWRGAFLRGLWASNHHGIPAEDSFHDAIVKCLTAPARLASDDEARAYLHRIVRNGTADEAREHGAGRRLRTVPLDDAGPELAAISADSSAGPLQSVVRRQRIERLGAALAELPERQREALVLHRFDGLTQDEVAERMGISRRMVVKHLGRAMAYCQVRVRYASIEQMQRQHPALTSQTVHPGQTVSPGQHPPGPLNTTGPAR